MGYYRGDSFPFNFKPNVVPFGSKSEGKLSPRSYPIQFERKWNTSSLSVAVREDVTRYNGDPIEIPPIKNIFAIFREISAGSLIGGPYNAESR